VQRLCHYCGQKGELTKVELSDADREEIIRLVHAGRSLPARYRASLFDDAPETELIWPGKTIEVERLVLPFQSIEHIDEPRGQTDAQYDLFSINTLTGRQSGGWTNKLIWGDNKLILSSLAFGPLKQDIDDAGGLTFVYIDPPFDVGADFSFDVEIGEQTLTKEPSVIEEVAYRDTWGSGRDSYVAMMSVRLRLIFGLLRDGGVLAVHVDPRIGSHVRLLMDDVFGPDNLINVVTWKRSHAHGDTGQGARHFGRVTEQILLYSKGEPKTWNPQYRPYTEEVLARDYKYEDPDTGERYRLMPVDGPGGASKGNPYYEFLGVKGYWRYSKDTMQSLYDAGEIVLSSTGKSLSRKRFLRDAKGTPVTDLWDDVNRISPTSSERVDYPTQKPEALLVRLLDTFTEPGDLVADFFCGSGTTLAVAERLGRKWLGADLGRYAIHTARKRLIQVQRVLAEEGKPYRAFEILNLGGYERQYFAGIDPTLPEQQRLAAAEERTEQFLSLILGAYGAQRAAQLSQFHGMKNSAVVFVGPIDAPVTQRDVTACIAAAKSQNVTRVDILGFEFEMGIKPAMIDEARDEGVTLTLRYIPTEVFDKRAVQRGQVKFFDVGYLDAKPIYRPGAAVAIQLENFAVFYAQQDADGAAEGLKKGGARVVVDSGQVVRVSKDKKGVITKEVLTKTWTDWIDYWSVDFDFESQRELVTQEVVGEVRTIWSGRYIFENQWQDFRSRGSRDLELTSAEHVYGSPGEYKVAVKVIDIFGNDTTKVIKVKVK
jgi:adenine-specific DNA-methyltransferase